MVETSGFVLVVVNDCLPGVEMNVVACIESNNFVPVDLIIDVETCCNTVDVVCDAVVVQEDKHSSPRSSFNLQTILHNCNWYSFIFSICVSSQDSMSITSLIIFRLIL